MLERMKVGQRLGLRMITDDRNDIDADHVAGGRELFSISHSNSCNKRRLRALLLHLSPPCPEIHREGYIHGG
jgi:hypothetical protein